MTGRERATEIETLSNVPFLGGRYRGDSFGSRKSGNVFAFLSTWLDRGCGVLVTMASLCALLLWWSVQRQRARDFGKCAENDGLLPSSSLALPLVASRLDFPLTRQGGNQARLPESAGVPFANAPRAKGFCNESLARAMEILCLFGCVCCKQRERERERERQRDRERLL